jgi:NAD+ kinase
MKRVLVLGQGTDELMPLFIEKGLEIVDESPDLVVTYGGDGLLLGSERTWPGVPKLPLRNSRHGKKCEPRQVEDALERLLSGTLHLTRFLKLQAEAQGAQQVGLNDVMVHNSAPTSSVRYDVWIDDVEYGREIVGDGVVVATPFGSTAYYRSITRGIFRLGIGLAFNNSTEQVDHMVLPEESVIRIRITRGPAVVVADNNPESIALDEGDEVTIRRHAGAATILRL